MKLYTTVLLSIIGLCVQAQQLPQYTNYIMNNYLLNPAVGGINNYWDVKVGFRDQWTGVTGSPKTMFVSFHGPVGYPNKRVRNSHLKAHHGVGGYVYKDVTGPLSMTGAYFSYSYHLKLSKTFTASAGAFLGILQSQLNNSQLVFVQNPDDPSVPSAGKTNRVMPDGSLGLWLHSDRVFFGLSVNQIFGNRVQFTNNTNSDGKQVYHYFLTGGYKIKLNQSLDLIPSTMIKYVQSAPVQVDINARLKYKNTIWMGASYRSQDALALLIGFNYNNKFDFGYSYDITTSRLRVSSWGSHEIILGINFASFSAKRKRVLCPMDYWN
jgi:type IX secretion system PorP/SprF family membrane protein